MNEGHSLLKVFKNLDQSNSTSLSLFTETLVTCSKMTEITKENINRDKYFFFDSAEWLKPRRQ